jgi:hypothetical protein
MHSHHHAEEFKWEDSDEDPSLSPFCQLRFFEPAVGSTPLGSRVAFGHFLSGEVPAFFHLQLTAGRISLTVELEKGSTEAAEDKHVRTVFTIFGLKGQAGASDSKAADGTAQAGWFGTYGPTAIIVGFWAVSWLQSWAKKNPMIQKAWKLAEEQAKEMQGGKGK